MNVTYADFAMTDFHRYLRLLGPCPLHGHNCPRRKMYFLQLLALIASTKVDTVEQNAESPVYTIECMFIVRILTV
jgi:hypothetical protein